MVDVFQLDIDRLNNMATSFGWVKVNEERSGNVVRITYQKTLPREVLGPEGELPVEIAGAT